jgi:hypothetical protein
MRSRLANAPGSLVAGLLVFVMSFGLFAATTGALSGYEDETAAVTEGLVLRGQFYEIEGSPIAAQGIEGKGGHLYARTGLLQPLLEAPFYAAGHLADKVFGSAGGAPFALRFLWFYNPFMAALGAVALFALVLMSRRSLAWAVAIAALYTAASIAWPYAKIGMDTTFMATIMIAFALAYWARGRPTAWAWGLTGFAAGAAAATKAYSVLALVALAVLLLPTFLKLDRRQQLRLGAAALGPVLLWGAAIAWYNAARFGSITDFGYSEAAWTLSMPLNFLGLFFSPGKGLFLYSPLVVLGALGVPRMWRADRTLTAALLTLLFILTAVSASSSFWGDEVWGPRYLVPAAWTLLVPIAWWGTTLTRRRVLTGLAAIAVLIQIVGVSVQYSYYIGWAQKLSGVQVYGERFGVDPQKIPYGDDPPRWIPELSPLLLQTEALISSQVIHPLGGDGIEATYSPFEGRSETIDFGAPGARVPVDIWWTDGGLGYHLLGILLLLAALASAAALYAMATGRRLLPGQRPATG